MNILMRKSSENPFYNQKELLALYQRGSAKCTKSELNQLLNSTWKVVEKNIQLKQMFFVIIFSFGDIVNRNHQIFGKQIVDQGGSSWREGFGWCLEWMKINCYPQYIKFVFRDTIRQFTGLFNIFSLRIKTKKYTKTVEQVINTLDGVNLEETAKYIANIIKISRNPVELSLIAKWLTNVRLSKRQKRDKEGNLTGRRDLLKQTVISMRKKEEFYTILSKEMGWLIQVHPNNIRFIGLNEWKKQYNGELESVLFSTGRIVEFDKEQFFTWLNNLPSGARYRTRRRLLDKDDKLKGKWKSKHGNEDLGKWFLAWEKFKESKQAEERVLTEKIRQGTASEEDKTKLKQVKKEAKVTTGGSNLFDEITKFLQGKGDALTIESIFNKCKFEVPVLVIADRSGSMGGLPTHVCRLITTLTLLKNPSEDLDNVLVTFGTDATIYSDRSKGVEATNRFTVGKQVVIEKLIDRNKSFLDNLNNIAKLIHSNDGGTNFDSVSKRFKSWLDNSLPEEKELKREMICKYPVFLTISDGFFNSHYSQEASLRAFQQNMLQWFGWNGVVVIWDVVSGNTSEASTRFQNLENVIHYVGWNIGIINTIFTKIHDLDIIDIYTPLKSLYESNRYNLIKENII